MAMCEETIVVQQKNLSGNSGNQEQVGNIELTSPKYKLQYNSVIYEAELDSFKDAEGPLKCASVTISVIALSLFIFSFPLSLIVAIFCLHTKRAFQPHHYSLETPWKLYLTDEALHYRLPNPPHRPYFNLLYCTKRFYSYEIPLKDIANIALENKQMENQFETESNSTQSIVVIELKPTAPGLYAPVSDSELFGFWPQFQKTHTLAIFSIKDAPKLVEMVKTQMKKF